MMRRIGLLFALAALSVNAPRLMLLYLEADGLALPAGVEGAMLMLTGLATGAVLTGGACTWPTFWRGVISVACCAGC